MSTDPLPPRKFYASFVTAYLMIMAWVNGICLLLIGVPILIFDRSGGWLASFEILAVLLAGGAVLELFLCTLIVFAFPTRVTAAGLIGPDFWGFKTTFRWDAIDRVRPLNMGGLRFLLVKSTDSRRTLWLPLFLRDRDGFVEAVERAAGDDHLVAAAYRHHRPGDE